MTWKEALLDWVMLGFWWLGCEGRRRVGQGSSGRDVRRETQGSDGGGGDLRAEVWILRDYGP